jgi:hypothetical protein
LLGPPPPAPERSIRFHGIGQQVLSLLEPGEQITSIIPCGTGRPDSWRDLGRRDRLYAVNRAVVVTDRSVLVLSMKERAIGVLEPRRVLSRLARDVSIGPIVDSTFDVDSCPYYVKAVYERDVILARNGQRSSE